jgi:hypothetical protein
MDDSAGLDLSLRMFDRSSEEYPGYDTTVKLQVPSIQYSFLSKYCSKLTMYLLV